MQYVSTLLPHNPNAPWVLFDVHDTTDGIFDHIADAANDVGFTRDAALGNVYWRDGERYVGYWTTLTGINQAIATRARGYNGGSAVANSMRDALAVLGDYLGYHLGPQEIPCPGCGAEWQDRLLQHTTDCAYDAWTEQHDGEWVS